GSDGEVAGFTIIPSRPEQGKAGETGDEARHGAKPRATRCGKEVNRNRDKKIEANRPDQRCHSRGQPGEDETGPALLRLPGSTPKKPQRCRERCREQRFSENKIRVPERRQVNRK